MVIKDHPLKKFPESDQSFSKNLGLKFWNYDVTAGIFHKASYGEKG